jgi:carbon-monoxide dehydrogenase medium subunit
LEPGELLVAIHLPPAPARGGSAYCRHRVRGTDYAIVGVGMGLTLAEDGETCLDARIGLVAAGATPLRAAEAEAVLRNQPVTDETLRRAGNVAAETCDPPDDTEASAWYRRQMLAVFVRRAGEIARERARGQRG